MGIGASFRFVQESPNFRRFIMASTAIAPEASKLADPAASWAPTAKVSAGLLASSVTILIVQFVPHANAWTPAAMGAITQIVTFIVQYVVPEKK
jgi:hypothetical protein